MESLPLNPGKLFPAGMLRGNYTTLSSLFGSARMFVQIGRARLFFGKEKRESYLRPGDLWRRAQVARKNLPRIGGVIF